MKLPTEKELEILRILASNPSGLYGLQLVEFSEGNVKRGSVYVYLGRLAEDKLVDSREEPAPEGYGGLPRRVYRITGHGSKVFEAAELMRAAIASVPA